MKKVLSLFMILMLSFVLVGCDSDTKKEDNDREDRQEEKREEKVVKKELELDDALVVKYYDLLRDDQGEFFSDVLSKKSTKASDLTDEEKLNIAARLLTSKEVKQDKYNNVSFTKTALDNHVKEVFGSDVKINYSKLNQISVFVQRENSPIRGMNLYGSYSSKNDTYNLTWGGMGGSCGLDDCLIRHTKLVNAYTEGDYLYITEKQIFVFEDWDTGSYKFNKGIIYKTKDKKESIGTIKKNTDSIDKFYDKGLDITLVFKKDKDNYIFLESRVGK